MDTQEKSQSQSQSQPNARSKVFRVKSSTASSELGSAIAHAVRDGNDVVLRAIGAGAINQAIKAFPIAKSFVAPYGIQLLLDAYFFEGKSPEGDFSGISLRIIVQEYRGWSVGP